MTLLKRRRVIGVQLELVMGNSYSVGTTDGNMNCYDIDIQPNIDFIKRPAQNSGSNHPGLTGAQSGTCTFKTDFHGDGDGTIPNWASVLLPACGWVDSGGVGDFIPSLVPPTGGTDATVPRVATIEVNENGLTKKIASAMGSFRFVMTAGQIVMIEWEFKGRWIDPVDDPTPLAPTYPVTPPVRFMNLDTFELDGVSMTSCIESLVIDSGNNVVVRPCASNAAGVEGGVVTDRSVGGTMNPESVLVADDDRFTEWISGTDQQKQLQLIWIPVAGTGTDTLTLNLPKTQIVNIQEGDREGVQTDEIEWQANKSADAGDDEFMISFDATP